MGPEVGLGCSVALALALCVGLLWTPVINWRRRNLMVCCITASGCLDRIRWAEFRRMASQLPEGCLFLLDTGEVGGSWVNGRWISGIRMSVGRLEWTTWGGFRVMWMNHWLVWRELHQEDICFIRDGGYRTKHNLRIHEVLRIVRSHDLVTYVLKLVGQDAVDTLYQTGPSFGGPASSTLENLRLRIHAEMKEIGLEVEPRLL